MVTGALSGLGKSTLAERLASELNERGHRVELFREADILDRSEFADVVSSFRSTGRASVHQLLTAAERYAATCRRGSASVYLQDMLFPYLPSLLAWGLTDDQICSFFGELRGRCQGVRMLQLHLEGCVASAIPRAIAREDDRWIDHMIDKVSRYTSYDEPVEDLASLTRYLEHAQRRTATLLERVPWDLLTLDADQDAEEVVAQAIDTLRSTLSTDEPASSRVGEARSCRLSQH
jgi:thymidylate kinase